MENLLQNVFLLNGFCVFDVIHSYHIAVGIIHVQFLSIIFTSVFTFPWTQSCSSPDCIFSYSCNALLHILHQQLKFRFFFSGPWPK